MGEGKNNAKAHRRADTTELWEQAGKPEGKNDDFWLLAERDLREKPEHSESAIVPG